MDKVKSVPILNEEALLLVQIVETHKAVTIKATNATSNSLKDEAWLKITSQFNSSISSGPRSTAQLRLKWENMKKAARKRSAHIRRNLNKTGGGKADFIPPDEALDRVAAILGATCEGYTVPYGGDGKEEVAQAQPTEPQTALPIVIEVCEDNGEDNDRPDVVLENIPLPITTPKKYLFGTSKSAAKTRAEKRKTQNTDDLAASQILRNHAFAKYYEEKTLRLAEKSDLQNKKNKLEIEKIELDNEKLKLEIQHLSNKSI